MPAVFKPLAITGLGAVSPFGVGVDAYVEALRAGRSGITPLRFNHRQIRSTVAAPVHPEVFDPSTVLDEADLKRVPRLVPMALAAAREALLMAGLADAGDDVERSRRIGLILGTGGGGIDFTLDQMDAFAAGKRASLWAITNATHGNLSGELSIRLGLRGPSLCVSTGCASSSDAMGLCLRMLSEPGDLDAMVVVGADAHVRWETLHGMELLGVINTADFAASGEDPASASRPFDATRSGFVLGEGAWAAVVERADAAAARGTLVRGTLKGYAATCDAYHRVRPEPSMDECVRAMRLAIASAGLAPEQIGVVHYHGTSTKLNDALETRAVKGAFGQHAARLKGHSVKGAIGHPQGASGLAAVVATVGCMSDTQPFLPPTANRRTPDPECDLDYTALFPAPVGEARSRNVLINCLAFGAKNSALVVSA